MDERAMARGLSRGSVRALELAVKRYTTYVGTVICRTLSGQVSREDMEEITADVFLSLWRHAEALREEEGLRAYIGAIARNAAVDFRRRQRPAGELPEVVSGEVVIALPTCRENLLFSNPDSIVVCGDQPDMIRRALEIGVSCVIICQAEVPQEFLAEATETCLISTPLDPYQAVRLIWHAMPISHLCKRKDLVSFHLGDYIDDVRDAQAVCQKKSRRPRHLCCWAGNQPGGPCFCWRRDCSA